MERNGQQDVNAAPGGARQRDTVTVSIQLLESGPRITQAYPFFDLLAVAIPETWSVVADEDGETPIRVGGFDPNRRRAAPPRDTVADGIFHERLKNHGWNQRIAAVIADLLTHGQPISETELLDLEVTTQKFELLLQGDFADVSSFQRQPEELAESRNHPAGPFRVLGDQHHDAIERVKQEMRLQLHLENLQLHPRQL